MKRLDLKGPVSAMVMSSDRLVEEYRRRTPGSSSLMERASASIPGGNTRTHGFHLPYPLAFESGEGPILRDVDGNRYIDLEYNGTSVIHGHAYGPIVDAMNRREANGSAWTGSSTDQVEFAELLCRRVASFERVRFFNSGTEAGMLAVKLARRMTGRPLIVKSWLGYHGFYEDLEAGLHGKGEMPNRTLLAPFGDALAFETLLADQGDKIAAVVLEPVLVTGVVRPPKDFLPRVREAVSRAGALLVFDECVMFRLAEGGAQEKLDVQPDLTILSKFIGGGIPAGVLGGSAALMDEFDPHRESFQYHGGTFNGNALMCAVGKVAVEELTSERIQEMDRAAERLEEGLKAKAATLGIALAISREGSILAIYFSDELPDLTAPGHDWKGGVVDNPDVDLLRNFHLACLNHGLFITPARELVLSTAFDEATTVEAIERAGDALAEVINDR